MGRHKKEIIDRIREFAQEGLYLSDVRLEGQKEENM
jgi:hypothetical protein